MKISVVIPTYNNAQFLPTAIESVLKQTRPPDEIIIADDGSTDNTPSLVANYGNSVEYIRFDHCGVYAVRNQMLQSIKGDWFFNLDADNWIEPEFIEKIEALANKYANTKVAFIYPDRISFGSYSREIPAKQFSIEKFKEGNFVDMNSLVKTEIALKFGFDPAFNSGWGDYDFFLTLAEHGYLGVPMTGSPLHYRVHSKSISSAAVNNPGEMKNRMCRIIEKHSSFFSKSDAEAAMSNVTIEAQIRLQISELIHSRQYGAAFSLLSKAIIKHPKVIFSRSGLLQIRKTLFRF